MIWAILALLGVPLWLIALALLGLVFRNRTLRKRPGNIPVRILTPGKKRWRRGHALWVSDVFAWRGSPAAWSEDLAQVRSVDLHVPDVEQRKKLHRLGVDAVVASLSLAGGTHLDVATRGEHGFALRGPFGDGQEKKARTEAIAPAVGQEARNGDAPGPKAARDAVETRREL